MDWYIHIYVEHIKDPLRTKQQQQQHANQFNGNKSIKTGSVSQL